MVLPMPSVPGGAPTSYTLSMRKPLTALIFVQVFVCFMKIMGLDFLGGLYAGIVVGLGYYALNNGMDVQILMYYGMMCLMNGVFDLVRLLDVIFKSPLPLFAGKLGVMYNLGSLAVVLAPVCGGCGAYMAYKIYQDQQNGGSSLYSAQGQPTSYTQGLPTHYGTTRTHKFAPFAGNGTRLGDA
mmetsp:Transcript_26400/g.68265  ORF Transcript_26400/g.68265 Transcript_26400/m.68265 type:complete len:183 (+) Transcript_26400:59-607(+)